jgi:cell division septation protein DedD
MAARRKSGAGDRVLEGKHVIGLFVIILLFSALFFSLGFKMGQSQTDVQAGTKPKGGFDSSITPRPLTGKHPNGGVTPDADEPPPTETDSRDSIPWSTHQNETSATPRSETAKNIAPTSVPPAKTAPASLPKNVMQPAHPAPALVKNTAVVTASRNKSIPAPASTPVVPVGSYTLQVAALKSEADALDLANNLRKRKFQAFVLPPQGDKFYRVQVGPFADQKAADAAKKGLDAAGFKAIVKH